MSDIKIAFQDFHHIFRCFADECRNEWTTVYKEFLTIINKIVEVYQIKIDKL